MGREKNNEDLLNAFKQIKEKLKLKNAAEKEEENANNDFNENEEDMEEEFLQNFAGLQN